MILDKLVPQAHYWYKNKMSEIWIPISMRETFRYNKVETCVSLVLGIGYGLANYLGIAEIDDLTSQVTYLTTTNTIVAKLVFKAAHQTGEKARERKLENVLRKIR